MKTGIQHFLLPSLGLCLLICGANVARAENVCVSSLFSDQENKPLQMLIEAGLPKDFSATLEFKSGLEGLRECLEGNYGVVALIGHTEEAMPGNPVLVTEMEIGGKTVDVPVSARFFDAFVSSPEVPASDTVSPSIHQLDLIACNADRAIRSNSGLEKLIQQQKWTVRNQPWDQTASADGEKLTELGGLTSLFIAEGLQNASDLSSGKPVYCLVDARGLPMQLDAHCYFDQIEVRNSFWEPAERGIYWLEVGLDPDRPGQLKALSADRVDQDEKGDLEWLEHIDSPQFKLELK